MLCRSLILLVLTIGIITLKDDPRHWKNPEPSLQAQNSGQTQLWFTNIVDHFNYQTTQTWQQRYWVIDNYFNPSIGPVFLFICGEYVCQGVPEARQWVLTMAQRFSALILTVEHRYYGQSMPYGNQSLNLDKMIHLNSEQALSDLAYFIQQIKSSHAHKVADNTPFISIGGSYPGALSAWFRAKYPHLTIGGIASSAVILAIQDFKDFDEEIYLASAKSGDFCVKAINNSNAKVQEILNSQNATTFKAQFKGGDKLTNDQFLFFWIDSIVGQIQYGARTTLCNNLANKTDEKILQFLIKNAQDNNDVYEYGSYYLKNTTFAWQNGQGSRSWYYQSCSQFGYWQTISNSHPMRSARLNLDFYKKFCNDAFGNNLWPKVDRKNAEYGGLNIKTTNLYMVNGDEDPWRWAGLQTSKISSITAKVANCTNCAHCVQLYTPSSEDSTELKNIRNDQFLVVQNWITTYWSSLKSTVNEHLNHQQHEQHHAFMRERANMKLILNQE